MRITLNGEDHEAGESASVQDLLEALELGPRRVAILLDDEVVRKSEFETTRLAPGCKVDVIQMVGGG